MDIADAFTTEAIEYADTNVDGEDEAAVRSMVQQIFTANEQEYAHFEENLAVLCFVAGRTYQKSLDEVENQIEITMTPLMVQEFMAFMAQRSQL